MDNMMRIVNEVCEVEYPCFTINQTPDPSRYLLFLDGGKIIGFGYTGPLQIVERRKAVSYPHLLETKLVRPVNNGIYQLFKAYPYRF